MTKNNPVPMDTCMYLAFHIKGMLDAQNYDYDDWEVISHIENFAVELEKKIQAQVPQNALSTIGDSVQSCFNYIIGKLETPIVPKLKPAPTSYLSPEDIIEMGFDCSKMTQKEFEAFAIEMGENAGMMESWWDTLSYVAKKYNLPTIE